VKNATHADLVATAISLLATGKLNKTDRQEAERMKELRSFARRDKESLSNLVHKYRHE
jgi:hypothetical protein